MLFILFLLTSTYALKTPILSIPIQTCQPATLSQTQERCTYNYNIINNYTYICATKLFIPNGCGNDKYVIFNLYNGNSLIDTYRKSYKEFRYINILSDIKLNVEPTLSFKIVNNITISREVIGGRIVFLVVDFYIDTDGTTSPTSSPTTSEPTYPTSSPTSEPTPVPTLPPPFYLKIMQKNALFVSGIVDVCFGGSDCQQAIMSNITLPTASGSGIITFTLYDIPSPYEKLNGQWTIGIDSNNGCPSSNNINSITKDYITAGIADYYYCAIATYSEIDITSVTILPETSTPTSSAPTSSPTPPPPFNLKITQNNAPFQQGNTQITINDGYSSTITMSNITMPTASGTGNITFTLSGFLSPYEKLNGQWIIGIGSNNDCNTNIITSISKADIGAEILNLYYYYCVVDSYSQIDLPSLIILPTVPTVSPTSPTSIPTTPTSSPTTSPTPYPTPSPSFYLLIRQDTDQFQQGDTYIIINGDGSNILMSNITLPTVSGSGIIIFTLSNFQSPYEKLNGQWTIGIGTNDQCSYSNIITSISKADINATITNAYYDYCANSPPYSQIYIPSVTILPETSYPTSSPTPPPQFNLITHM